MGIQTTKLELESQDIIAPGLCIHNYPINQHSNGNHAFFNRKYIYTWWMFICYVWLEDNLCINYMPFSSFQTTNNLNKYAHIDIYFGWVPPPRMQSWILNKMVDILHINWFFPDFCFPSAVRPIKDLLFLIDSFHRHTYPSHQRWTLSQFSLKKSLENWRFSLPHRTT